MILVNGTSILANNVTDNGSEWVGDDIIIPKSVVPSAIMISATLPSDFTVSGYEYVNGVLQKIIPPAPPIVVPATISPRQIRQQLTVMGLRTQVENSVAAGTQDLKDWWNYATTFDRAHPMVIAMATQLGVTSTQLDQLFIDGAKL